MGLAIFTSFGPKPVELAPFLIPVGFYCFCLVITIVRFNLEVKMTKAIILNTLSKEKQRDARQHRLPDRQPVRPAAKPKPEHSICREAIRSLVAGSKNR